ncbi:MAG: hypothetical protein JNK52_15415 [Zoogloeaceae bacterium]|nr:hypothetical protein [Zoogloeaceae bacterium]
MGLNTPVIDAMAMMYDRGKANMSDADLEELGCLSELAVDEARRMGEVCAGLGCLIAYDGGSGSPRAGSFSEHDDVSTLLFALGHSFDVLAGMMHVGERATYESSLRAMNKQTTAY